MNSRNEIQKLELAALHNFFRDGLFPRSASAKTRKETQLQRHLFPPVIHHNIRIKDELKRPVAASPVMTTSRGRSWGKQLPKERVLETATTRHTSPQPGRRVQRKSAAPLSGAGEQTAHAPLAPLRGCACLLHLYM
jgi:hypothetical protein